MSSQRKGTLFALALLFCISVPVEAGTLSCSVTTATACTSPAVVILRMGAATNTHSELSTQSTAAYASNVICCTGVTGLGNTCGGTFATVAKLAAVTNSHIEENTGSTFTNNACMSVTAGTVTVGYQASNCTGFDTTLASIPTATNSQIGSPASYTTKICGTAAAGSQTLSFSLGSNTVNLSALSSVAAVSGSHTLNVSTNAASGMTVTVTGTTLTFGTNTITACATGCTSNNSSNQFGINLVANTTPAVGLAPSGSAPIGVAVTNYGIANTFRFASGETIASSAGAINDTTYTVSYLANISALQPAGNYRANLEYVATANF